MRWRGRQIGRRWTFVLTTGVGRNMVAVLRTVRIASPRQRWLLASGLLIWIGTALMTGCGAGVSHLPAGSASGSLVTFATDAPVCDVESFSVAITSASLVPENGGSPVPLISSTAPATVDFARLADFTSILNLSNNVPAGTYTGLQLSLANPQLVVLNPSVTPPIPQAVPATLATASLTITISPALVTSTESAAGLTVDFDLQKSLQVNNSGQVTGTVDPQIAVSAAVAAGSTVGEADALYGMVQSVTAANLPVNFTGSFVLALGDGTGQTLTVLSNDNTVFEGDDVAKFSDLTANTFVEVDAIVNTGGQLVAQTIDAEEQTSAVSQKSAFLGTVLSVQRPASGNATAFTLLVDDEVPSLSGTVPVHSTLNVTLQGSVHYFTNWQNWNRQAFTFGPQTLGAGEKVAVFGVLQAGGTLAAGQVFLRPRNIAGNFKTLQKAGSDGKSGGFSLVPCGDLLSGQPLTVVTYSDTSFSGVGGLAALTATPTLNTTGVLFYQLVSGKTAGGASWTAPAWVMQARGIRQLPD